MAKVENTTTQWPADKMNKYDWLDEYLQKQPGTEKEFQPAWQAYKYMLRGKMYAFIGVNDNNGRPIISLKLEPTYSELLRRQYADIVPGYYMNKIHWSSVYLDGDVPKDVLAEMIQASHKVLLGTLSKKAQAEILSA